MPTDLSDIEVVSSPGTQTGGVGPDDYEVVSTPPQETATIKPGSLAETGFNPLAPPLGNQAPEESLWPSIKGMTSEAVDYLGNIARAGVADTGAGLSLLDRPQNVPDTLGPSLGNLVKTVRENMPYAVAASGNLPAAIMGKPLPIDEIVKQSAQQAKSEDRFPTEATIAKLSQDLSQTAPLLAIGGLPATAQKLIMAGFTAKMISDAPELARQLGDEFGKPKDQQDPDKISSLVSKAIQTTGFSIGGTLAATHGLSGKVADWVTPDTSKFQVRSPENDLAAMVLGGGHVFRPEIKPEIPPQEGAQNAIEIRPQPPSGQPEYQGTTLGANPPENAGEIWKGGGGSSINRDQPSESGVQPAQAQPVEDVSPKAREIMQRTGMSEADAEAVARTTITDKAKTIPEPIKSVASDLGLTTKPPEKAAGIDIPDDLSRYSPEDQAKLRELKATQPTVVELTDRRSGSDTEGLTIHPKADATKDEVLKMWNDAKKGYTPIEKTAGVGEEMNKLQRLKEKGSLSPDQQKRYDELLKADQGKAQKEAWKKQMQAALNKGKSTAPAAPPLEEADIQKQIGELQQQRADATSQAEKLGKDGVAAAAPFTKKIEDLQAKLNPETKTTLDRRLSETQSRIKKAQEKLKSKPTAPEMVGMGGALSGEVSTGAGADIYGIAQRVREQRAQAGQVAPVNPGKGISAPDSVEHGRELLQSGANAEAAVSTFEKTKAISSDSMALARAKGEELAKSARSIEEKFGTDSNEYRMAFKALSDWDARTKPMQTEWHKAGMAQQGETDIDTGSFTGLQRAYKNSTGKDFTPGQADTAEGLSKKVKKATAEADTAKQRLLKQLDLQLGPVDVPETRNLDEARAQFAQFKSGSGFTPQQVKTLWNAAKKFYIEKGETDFDTIRNGLATDFGMKVGDVTRALAQPKGTRVLTDEMWKKQRDARRLDQQAKRWVNDTALPMYKRAIQSVPRVLFSLKVGFHGTVALGTHAPMVAFQPPFWKTYVTDFAKMYKMVGSPSYYEMQMQDLLRRPNFTTARRAGLVNDPFTYEDFNSPDISQYVGRLTGMGNRGYSVLKILRQDMFDQHWNNLPQSARNMDMAKAIADGVNHATGVVKVNAPKGTNIAFFAPRLEMSRGAWLTVDPAKAADTFLRWNKATDSEKQFAVNQIKEKAWVVGTLSGLLALNAGVLAAVGSKQKVNITDPMKSDWMKFKAGDMTFSYGNPMLTMARLPVRLYQIRESSGGKLKNLIYPDENTYSVLGEYARSQLSPFASLATTLWLKGDWANRPLPNSTRPVPKRLRAQGVEKYTWPEFWSEQVLPIPAEEAVREVWKSGLGMSDEQIKSARKALATIAIMSATGARLTDDVPPKGALTAQNQSATIQPQNNGYQVGQVVPKAGRNWRVTGFDTDGEPLVEEVK